MSKCMTIADETIDQKDTCTEITPKDIVDFILEEVLVSAFVISDKGCSRIGDFSIRQPQDQVPHPKDFEQVDRSEKQSNLSLGENVDRSARENLGLIIDSFARKEDKSRSTGEYTVVTEEILANNELQIQNGQIHIERNEPEGEKETEEEEEEEEEEKEGRSNLNKESVVPEEKIEIEYFNDGKLNKIYVSSKPSECAAAVWKTQQEDALEGEPEEPLEEEPEKSSQEARREEDPERPFKPFTTEELRQSTLQVWGNGNSSLVGRWDGDVLAQREEAVRLMEELSSVHVFPEGSADPNRPRACAFAEEDVKKMIKEIEEISFAQCHANSEDGDVVYHPDGQGDADLETKSSIFKSKDDYIAKPQNHETPQEEFFTGSVPEYKSSNETEKTSSSEGVIPSREKPTEITCAAVPASQECPTTRNRSDDDDGSSPSPRGVGEERRTPDEEFRLPSLSSLYGESAAKGSRQKMSRGPSCGSLLTARKEEEGKASEIFRTDSSNLKGFHNDLNICKEYFPETMSLSGNVGSLSGSKLDECTLRNLEFASELDVRAFQGKRSDVMRASRSLNDTHGSGLEVSSQGTIILGGLHAASAETNKRLEPDSVSENKHMGLVSMEANLFVKNTEGTSKSEGGGNFLQGSSVTVQITKTEEDFKLIKNEDFDLIKSEEEFDLTKNEEASDSGTNDGDPHLVKNEEDSHLIGVKIGGKLEKAPVVLEKYTDGIESEVEENADGRAASADTERAIATQDASLMLGRNPRSGFDSDQSLSNAEKANGGDDEVDREPFPASRTPSHSKTSSESIDENGLAEDAEAATQKFRLQSQKMYLGANYELAGQEANEFSLTKSEEAFIDITESVIQIIDPSENSAEEDSSKISFSLLSEVPNLKSVSRSAEREFPLERDDSSDLDNPTKRVYSGMTTIGPLKNVEYDPKDLTAPEIDFGKMTRITSSRQLANDLGMFNPDVTTIKILEEEFSDENASVNIEEDRLEHTSLVNRDIASLTKVQKIREVMSYQPKPEEDFEDEEVLARPRLDLKDVESMTDERYKVPDVSIPILSFEIGENELNTEKELISSMSLVISGLTNPIYYEEDIEEDDGEDGSKPVESLEAELMNKHGSKTVEKDAEEETSDGGSRRGSESKLESGEEQTEPTLTEPEGSSHQGGIFNQQKYGTLGSVFKKASNKFIRRDGELFVRSSKSLPRDASRMSATDSIRSMIDDCQSSASTILKKSRSLLKNTQSVFKSISQGRVIPDSAAGRVADQKKSFSPSESDVSAMEKKFSGFLKMEDFTKAKNLIKCKVEKLRGTDSGTATVTQLEGSPEKRELRVAIINKENLQVDRMENFKKFQPKTPLVYKSQFVKSQMNVQNNLPESEREGAVLGEDEDEKKAEGTSASEVNSEKAPNEETEMSVSPEPRVSEKEVAFQENLQWLNSRENLEALEGEQFEPQQPEFIIMETVQGLPAGSDLESPSSEKENLNVTNIGNVELEKGGDDLKKAEANSSSSLQTFSDGGHDVAPCFPEIDDEKALSKPPSERKIKTKKKKFTARFRSFWCSAFGRVKTPPAKGDLS